MLTGPFFETELFNFVLLPLFIFFLRVTDVSIGTIRIIFVSRGNHIIAPILGFFEVLVWVIAIGNIIQHLDNWVTYIAYAGGFAAGNYIGMRIEERLALGVSLIRVIAKKELTGLSNALTEAGFGTTTIDARGKESEVNIIFVIVKRKSIQKAIDLIQEYNPKAFYTIEDIRYASHDYTSVAPQMNIRKRRFYLFNGWRKGK